MKKIATLLLAAAMTLGAVDYARAIDFKMKGQWIMSFDYGQNGRFTGGNGTTGFWKGGNRSNEDDFEARQRIRLQLDAVASEALSGTVHFEIGESFWGRSSQGAALGADGTSSIKLRWAYLDWMPPDTPLKVRMGIQLARMPNFTTGSMVLGYESAGIIANYKFNDNVGVSPFWLRPFNDNFTGTDHNGLTNYRAGYMDNMDMFGLTLPLTFDGVRITPWGMVGGIGPNTFRVGNVFDAQGASYGQGNFARQGLVPAGGAMHRDGTSAAGARKLSSYGTAWWAGIGGAITAFDPFRMAFDVNYGSVNWEDDGRLNRSGWLATLLLEYKMDWGIPGILAWYGSGDDSNPANGSERMPSISFNSANRFSHFAFKGEPYIARGGVVGRGMDGTWGIGARIKDFTFIDDLKHTFRVNMIGGTNSPTMAKKMSINGMASNGWTYGAQEWGTTYNYGREEMYLTTEDYALEFGFTTNYKMYENFTINLDANYVAMWLDKSNAVWGRSKMNGRNDEVNDAWNINMSFVYSF